MGILVFDVGTSSMRGVLMNEQADILCQFQEKYHPDFHLSIYVTQNPEIWRSVLYDIAKNIQIWCEEHGHKVEMISLTAQRTSMIPVDRDGNALCDAVMWQDKRNIKTCMRLAGYDGDIIRRSGTMVNPVFAGSKMAWLHENEPEIYDRSYKLFVHYEQNIQSCTYVQMDCIYVRTIYLWMSMKNTHFAHMCKT